mmetsp:Transcript_24649/g.49423  ORF Transcript_24649/g.49423 Transcript_24649/m.49423 type:complete len:207 (-) Transcript_24649:315-935(-)
MVCCCTSCTVSRNASTSHTHGFPCSSRLRFVLSFRAAIAAHCFCSNWAAAALENLSRSDSAQLPRPSSHATPRSLSRAGLVGTPHDHHIGRARPSACRREPPKMTALSAVASCAVACCAAATTSGQCVAIGCCAIGCCAAGSCAIGCCATGCSATGCCATGCCCATSVAGIAVIASMLVLAPQTAAATAASSMNLGRERSCASSLP